jgi:hypothetical protein
VAGGATDGAPAAGADGPAGTPAPAERPIRVLARVVGGPAQGDPCGVLAGLAAAGIQLRGSAFGRGAASLELAGPRPALEAALGALRPACGRVSWFEVQEGVVLRF